MSRQMDCFSFVWPHVSSGGGLLLVRQLSQQSVRTNLQMLPPGLSSLTLITDLSFAIERKSHQALATFFSVEMD